MIGPGHFFSCGSRKPAFAENIKLDLQTSATSLSAYERALEGFVRRPGEVDAVIKNGETVVRELAALQTSIEKGPNMTFAIERTQAVLKDLRGVTQRVQADLDLIKAKPKLAADILFFENWPYPKDRNPPVPEKIRKYARDRGDHLDDLWQKAVVDNADRTYVKMVEGDVGRNAVSLNDALVGWQKEIQTKNQDNVLDPTQALKNPLRRCRDALDEHIKDKTKRENLEAALSAISLVVSHKLKTL